MEEMMAPIGTSSSPTWKLYDNPHFSKRRHTSSFHQQHHPYPFLSKSKPKSSIHPRKLFAPMDAAALPDLDAARKQIAELRAALEFERRMRRKVESLNKALSRELAEERKATEAAEDSCKRLANEVASMREAADRMVREVEEEKRMLRISEVWREERLQMKLAEARLLMEEKIRESRRPQEKEEVSNLPKAISGDGQQRRELVENPHIKRGIKGFVEFPRAIRVRAIAGIGSSPREGRGHMASANLECQRAQLRVLLRQRSAVASGLMGAAAENLVM